jgi:RimJ/RimL family protein N-acetyltransferase
LVGADGGTVSEDPRRRLELRPVEPADLERFFEFMQDDGARHMAAFGPENPADVDAHRDHWRRLLADPTVIARTIVVDGAVVGNVVSFESHGERELGYWVERGWWGRGVATEAVARFLEIDRTRPLFARAASDNVGSRRVLTKCGFETVGEEHSFAPWRGAVIAETIARLDAAAGT